MNDVSKGPPSLRIALFSSLPWACQVVQSWAGEAGHDVVVLVTEFGGMRNPYLHVEMAALVERGTTMVLPGRVADIATHLRSADIDLGIIAGFGRVPTSLGSTTRHGIVNLHPALLPERRGSNAYRPLYEADAEIGASLHRITEEFDAGPLLSRSAAGLPEVVTPASAVAVWTRAMTEALEEGVPKAVRDEAGAEQRGASVGTMSAFTVEEAELPLDLPVRILEARLAALVLAGKQPYVTVAGRQELVRAVHRAADEETRLAEGRTGMVVELVDGPVELELGEPVAWTVIPERTRTALQRLFA